MEPSNGHSDISTNSFLHKEYELCFAQLKFYDERQINLIKYLFTLSTTVSAAQFALYKTFDYINYDFFICLAFLSTVVVIGSILILLSILQNRLYFVYTARQINAIRGHLLKYEAPMFTKNQLYTKTDFLAIKPFSVHTFKLIGSAFITALFAGSATYALSRLGGYCYPWFIAGLVSLCVLIGLVIGGYNYLKIQGAKSADQAIHDER